MGCCGCLKNRCTQRILRFLFSDFGLCLLVVTYTIAGGFIFIAIEGDGEIQGFNDLVAEAKAIEDQKNATIMAVIMNSAVRGKNDTSWQAEIHMLLDVYQAKIARAANDLKYRGYVPKPEEMVRGWQPTSAILFTATILTTIGYGHVYPVTEIGRLTVIFYAIFAVPLMTLFLTNIGMGMADVITKIWNGACCQLCSRKKKREAQSARVASGMDQVPQQAWTAHDLHIQEMLATEEALKRLDQEEKERRDVPVFLALAIVICYVLCGTILFKYWQGWTMTESGYFCMVSLLTIGFGDYVPGMGDSSTTGMIQKAFASFYIILGLSMLAMGMNLVTHTIKHSLKKMAAKVAEKTAHKLHLEHHEKATMEQQLYHADHEKELRHFSDFPRATPIGHNDNRF